MKYIAVTPEGRVVMCEIVDDGVKICRRQSHGSLEEYIEAKDRSGVEAYGIELLVASERLCCCQCIY